MEGNNQNQNFNRNKNDNNYQGRRQNNNYINSNSQQPQNYSNYNQKFEMDGQIKKKIIKDRPRKPKRDFSNKNFPFNYRYWVPEIEIKDIETTPQYIRVMSYNILCDSLLSVSTQIQEEDLINYAHMSWENRKKAILNEIKELKPDVICLQEFERDEDLIRNLGVLKYDVKINF